MTTSTRPLARHRSAASNPTMTALTASVATGARRYRRRSAVIAASSGLVVTMGLPAVAVAAPHADEAEAATASLPAVPVETTTAVIAVDPGAEVDLALGETASVDSSEAERREAEAAAAAAAAARAEAERAAAEQAARVSATSTALASRAASPRASRSTDRSGGGTTATAAVAAAPAAAPVAVAPSGSGGGAIAIGQRYTGTPYVWGGTTPSGFDCSGFVQYVYRQMGISLPRTAAAQQGAGRRVSASEARPGDIVSFTGGGGVYHNGLYVGNGQMLDSPRTGKSVGIRSIWSTSVTFTRVG